MNASTDRSAFADGLGLDALQPPQIEVFLRSVPRRVSAALDALADAAPTSDAKPDRETERRASELVDRIADQLAAVGDLLPGSGSTTGLSASDHDDARADRVAALAEQVSGGVRALAVDEWHPNLLSGLRRAVGRIAEPLRSLESLPAGHGDPDA